MEKSLLIPTANEEQNQLPNYNSTSDHISSTNWEPYGSAWTESPSLDSISTTLSRWIKLRQLCLRNPLFMYRIPFPITIINGRLTLGELILFLLTIGATTAYCTLAIINKYDVKDSGGVSAFVCAAAFALATRNSIFTLLLGIPFERALFWHQLLVLATLATGWTHGVLGIIDDDQDEKDKLLSGYVYGAVMSAMFVLSVWPIRRKIFNIFYGSHLILAVIVVISGAIHGSSQMFIGVGLWGTDLILRLVYLSRFRNPRECQALRLPANVIRLTFEKRNMVYTAGQYVFIMIPNVSIFEWHPFSLSSSPNQDKVTLHIRVLGNWTRSLYNLVSDSENSRNLKLFIEGPYGSPEVDVQGEKYKMFLLISGGIGITPMQSMANSLLYQHEQENRPLRKICFIWSCADKYMVSATFQHDSNWTMQPPRAPLSFQPDNLVRFGESQWMQTMGQDTQTDSFETDDVLHTELYLTRARSAADYQDANILPDLQPFLKFGRPDLPAIFGKMRNAATAYGEAYIATLVCGPTSLINDVRYFCYRESKNGVKFDYHGEMFQF